MTSSPADINARGYAAQAAAQACEAGVNVRAPGADQTPITYDTVQLQKKFVHAGDFGVKGNYNPANGQAFQQKMDDFLQRNSLITIDGNYRGQAAAIFNVQPSTNLMVMQEANGAFWDAYKLSPAQLQGILQKGFLW